MKECRVCRMVPLYMVGTIHLRVGKVGCLEWNHEMKVSYCFLYLRNSSSLLRALCLPLGVKPLQSHKIYQVYFYYTRQFSDFLSCNLNNTLKVSLLHYVVYKRKKFPMKCFTSPMAPHYAGMQTNFEAYTYGIANNGFLRLNFGQQIQILRNLS